MEREEEWKGLSNIINQINYSEDGNYLIASDIKGEIAIYRFTDYFSASFWKKSSSDNNNNLHLFQPSFSFNGFQSYPALPVIHSLFCISGHLLAFVFISNNKNNNSSFLSLFYNLNNK